MDVKFFYNPELNESVTVRLDGRVSLQLAHEIPAAGLTPAELTQALMESHARELNRPEIAVILRNRQGTGLHRGHHPRPRRDGHWPGRHPHALRRRLRAEECNS